MLVVGLVVGEQVSDGFRHYLADHPLTTDLLGAICALAITTMEFEEIVSSRDARTWMFMRDRALRRLSSSALIAIAGLMAVFGFDEYGERLADAWDEIAKGRMHPGADSPGRPAVEPRRKLCRRISTDTAGISQDRSAAR